MNSSAVVAGIRSVCSPFKSDFSFLRHSDTDQIYTGFQEVLEFLTCQEAGEYSAANARLMTQISLLYEAEQFTLKNVL